MRQLVVVTMVAAFSGALAAVACGSDEADGRPTNPDFEHPGSSGSNGSSSSSGTSGSGPTVGDGAVAGEVAAYCAGTYGAVVASYETCCKEADKTTVEYKFGYPILSALAVHCAAALDRSLAQGRVADHPDQVQTCANETAAVFGAGKCSGIAAAAAGLSSAACRGAFTGQQAVGAPCRADYECRDGYTCIAPGGGNEGTCQTPPALGAACGMKRGPSAAQLELSFGTHPGCASGAVCKNDTCVAEAAPGSPCTSQSDCTPLKCHLGTCGSTGPTAAGTTCRLHEDCTTAYCAQNEAGPDGTCTTKAPNGTACAVGYPSCQGRCDNDGGEPLTPGTCASLCGSP